MSQVDPFVVLGINNSSSSDEIRRAWRTQARKLHPDTGGSHARMVELNQALADALALARVPSEKSLRTVRRDVSVFTIAAPIGTAWKSLVLVAGECGSVIMAEEPDNIEFTLHDSSLQGTLQSWCRCHLVPEAGAVTVNVEVGAAGAAPIGLLELVRDHLVSALNALDWPN